MSQTRVDTLLLNGTIVTMDEKRNIIPDGGVAILGTEILEIGPSSELEAKYIAENTLDCSAHVVMPGLINTHTHMPMSLLRGIADDLRLDVWLYGYMLPVEREFVNPEFCFLGTQLSCAEMMLSGTTCFADMYYHEEEVAWAAEQAGMRGVCGETVMTFPTPDATSYDKSLQYIADFCQRWQGHDLIVAAPAPHSPYMTTAEILKQTTAIASQYNVPQLIHVSETADEVTSWLNATGMRPFRWLEEQGILDAHCVAAHCVHVNREEMQIMAAHHVGVAHNPTSNLKLASGIAPVIEMMDAGVDVGIGTDGASSNNDLDMFEETRLAALLPKGVLRNPLALPAQEAIAMATIYGARVLGMEKLIGSLEAGKRADIIVVNMDSIHNVPHFETTGLNVYSRLAYATKGSDVRDVLINGRLTVQDHHLLTLDAEDLVKQASQTGQRVNKFFVAHGASVLDKLLSIGGLEQQETFEVQGKGRIVDDSAFMAAIENNLVTVTRHTKRDQYDTYFEFDDPKEGRLRYREDIVLGESSDVSPIYFLTLTGLAREAEYHGSVVLSRSRYTAPADKSLRFYREYFEPKKTYEVTKHRERYHIRYKGLDFAVNIDRITAPVADGLFIEVKSRTWSEQDAIIKARMVSELLTAFGVGSEGVILEEYVDLLS